MCDGTQLQSPQNPSAGPDGGRSIALWVSSLSPSLDVLLHVDREGRGLITHDHGIVRAKLGSVGRFP